MYINMYIHLTQLIETKSIGNIQTCMHQVAVCF